MPNQTHFAYVPSALRLDAGADTCRLTPSFDWRRDRLRITAITADQGQVATVHAGDGELVTTGPLEVSERGTALIAFRVDGRIVGFAPRARPEVGHHDQGGGAMSCFGPQTQISTEQGEVPVEWLCPGEMLLTRDDGLQELLWVGSAARRAGHYDTHPQDTLIEIAPEALRPGQPSTPLRVTPAMRLLMGGPSVALHFGEEEALAAAEVWRGAPGISVHAPQGAHAVWHLLCAEHQIILANGAWAETHLWGDAPATALPPEGQAAFVASGSDAKMRAARLCLTRGEAGMLMHPALRGAVA